MRVAAIDLGTNSTRLLVADLIGGGGLLEQASESVVTRMGEGVDAGGVIGAPAIARVLEVLGRYRALMDDLGVERAVALLTSAGRDAANGPQVAEQVSGVLGAPTRIISGDEEARLVYLGATARHPHGGETAVLDVGGGSTELAIGTGETVVQHGSAQVGVVRHKERFLHHDPPLPEEIAALRENVHAQLTAVARGRRVPQTISVGGTPVSCATMLGHDPADGAMIAAERCEELLARIVTLTEAELRAIQGLHPARAPAIVAGIAIHLEALAVLGASSFEVSEHDLRHGAVLELAVPPPAL